MPCRLASATTPRCDGKSTPACPRRTARHWKAIARLVEPLDAARAALDYDDDILARRTWSPEWNWKRFRSCHPDHLATGAAALTAIYPDAGNPFALTYPREEEGLEPWTVPEVWLINGPDREVNHYVDITGTFDRKAGAAPPTSEPEGTRRDPSTRRRAGSPPRTASQAAAPAGSRSGTLPVEVAQALPDVNLPGPGDPLLRSTEPSCHWASQPGIRPIANSTANIATGKPMAW